MDREITLMNYKGEKSTGIIYDFEKVMFAYVIENAGDQCLEVIYDDGEKDTIEPEGPGRWADSIDAELLVYVKDKMDIIDECLSFGSIISYICMKEEAENDCD